MAQYKYSNYLFHSDNAEYDKIYTPGANCANSGIYRCEGCRDEVASNKGNPFPPQNHHQHAPEPRCYPLETHRLRAAEGVGTRVRPNPSIEGTCSGLRPPHAPHVER